MARLVPLVVMAAVLSGCGVAAPTPQVVYVTPAPTLSSQADTPAPSAPSGALPETPRLVAVKVVSDTSSSQAGYAVVSVVLALENNTGAPVTVDLTAQPTLSVAEGRSYSGGWLTTVAINALFVPPGVTLCGVGLGLPVYDMVNNSFLGQVPTPFTVVFRDVPVAAHPATVSIMGLPDVDLSQPLGTCEPRLPTLQPIPFAMDLPLPQAGSGSRLEVRGVSARKLGMFMGTLDGALVEIAIANGSVLDPIDFSLIEFSAISGNGYVGYQAGQCVDPACAWTPPGPGQTVVDSLVFEKGVGPLVALVIHVADQYAMVGLSK